MVCHLYLLQESESSSQLRFTSTTAMYDMSPFFLRQYVKEHPLDVFEVFPQLQVRAGFA